MRILLLEDDRRIVRFVAKGLRGRAYAVEREHGKLVYSFDIRNSKHYRRGEGQRDNRKNRASRA